MTLNGDVIEKVTNFSYLRDVLSFGGRVQEAATARIRYKWNKFKDKASVLCKRVVSLKMKEGLYKSCVSALGYGFF